MTFFQKNEELRAVDVVISKNHFTLTLKDGRMFKVPFSAHRLLADATESERKQFEIFGNGVGIHWPLVDEDLSVSGLVRDFGDMELKRA